VFRVSRVFAVLEMVLGNSSVTDNVVDILKDVRSLRTGVGDVQTVINSCEFSVLFFTTLQSGFEKDTGCDVTVMGV